MGGTFFALTRENGKGCRHPLVVLPYMPTGCVMARIQIRVPFEQPLRHLSVTLVQEMNMHVLGKLWSQTGVRTYAVRNANASGKPRNYILLLAEEQTSLTLPQRPFAG